MKKRLLAIFLMCMFFVITAITASAVSGVNIFNLTVEAPKVGNTPATIATLPDKASTYVTGVEWEGKFDSQGKFVDGEEYTVYATVRIKDGMDKVILYVADTVKVNGEKAMLKDISADRQQAVIYYTFSLNSSEAMSGDLFESLSVSEPEWEVLELVNIERAKEGLDSLSMLSYLQDACDIREKELVQSFSHTRPDGGKFNTAITDSFFWMAIGENIAMGQPSPEVVVNNWMDSPGHRANIMNVAYGCMGVGHYSNGNTWVQIFSDRGKIVECTVNTDERVFTPEKLKSVYLTLKTSKGYTSYMPLSFDSMIESDGKYIPRIKFDNCPVFYNENETGSAVEPEYVKPTVIDPEPVEPPSGNDANVTGPVSKSYGSGNLKALSEKLNFGEEEWELLRLINRMRTSYHLSSFTMVKELQDAAAIRVTEIAKDYSPIRPDGTPYYTAIADLLPGTITSENKLSDIDNVEDAFEFLASNSTGELFRSDFGYIGIFYDENTHCWDILLSGRKNPESITASTDRREFPSSEAAADEYLIYRSGDNIVSYAHIDYEAMLKTLSGYIGNFNPVTNNAVFTIGGDSADTEKKDNTSSTTFIDVPENVYYTQPVRWAVDRNITTGTSATTFSPDNTCTRAQILTFMWRAVGSPNVNISNPFNDISSSDYYYGAALWAYKKGMVTGSVFAGDTPCTREETVIYLWKNAGSPYADAPANVFTDIKAGSQCANAVAWAVQNGVTNGMSPTTFMPELTCTRGQIVTFLQRAIK